MLPLIVLAAAGLQCGSPARADAAGCERLLREGAIVSSEEVGEGITGALRLVVRLRDQEARAVFKSVETVVDGYRYGTEKVARFRDSWKHEVAAYELDRLLGLGLVPATVERRLDGRRGSVQAWVDRPLERFRPSPPPADAARADHNVHAQRLFDYLVFNTDRHVNNVLLDASWRPVAIDNSIAFHPFLEPYRPLYRFPRAPLAALKALDPKVLAERMKGLLEKEELKGLLARRERVLELAKEAETRDPAGTLFDW